MSTSAPEDGAPRPADPARDLGRLRRTTSDSPYGRHIAGVAGGLARHLDIDPLVVRIALVVAMVFGVGIFFYVALWLLVPEDGRVQAPVHLDTRTRTVLLWGTAAVAAIWLVGIPFGTRGWFPWPLLVIGIAVAIGMNRRERRRAGSAGTTAVPSPATTTVEGAPTAPTSYAPTSYTPLRPGRNGPVWFGFAIATIALAEGILALIAVSGDHLNASAYPALALGIIGGYLVIGAFWGRAGGLIALGIVATFATVIGSAVNGVGPARTVDVTPTSASAVLPTYSNGTGSLTLDLTQVRDPKDLDGRTVDLSGTFGRILVIVPSGTGVDFHANVRGAGSIQTWADEHDGPRASYDQYFPAAAGHPTITLDASIRFGAIQLRSE